jgi:hypothetical protein
MIDGLVYVAIAQEIAALPSYGRLSDAIALYFVARVFVVVNTNTRER